MFNTIENCNIHHSLKSDLLFGEKDAERRSSMSSFWIEKMKLTKMEQGVVWAAGFPFAFNIFVSLIHAIVLLVKMCRAKK